MKPVGEPYEGNPHVRFDERGWETERCRMAQATAPILDRTGLADFPHPALRPASLRPCTSATPPKADRKLAAWLPPLSADFVAKVFAGFGEG